MSHPTRSRPEVLIVAPVFLPCSYPPALRIRQFANYLPEYGWKVRVLTTYPSVYEWPSDPELELLISPEVEVIRVPAVPVPLTRHIGIGDLGLLTLPTFAAALIRECRRRRPDVLLLSLPPNYTALLGRLIYSLFGIPYVVDFQDPWIVPGRSLRGEWRKSWKFAVAYLLATHLEPFALRHASHLVGVTTGVTDPILERYSQFGPGSSTEISFGGESQEFDHVRAHPKPNSLFDPDDGLIHVSYLGVVIPDMADALHCIFRGAALGLQQDPDAFARLRLHFAGTTYAADGRSNGLVNMYARECGVEHLVIEQPGRLLYLDTVRAMVASHGLLIAGPSHPYYGASKLYPSILARKPLLAVLHRDCPPVRVLQETRGGQVITFGPEAPAAGDAYRWLHDVIHSCTSVHARTDWENFERFTARTMAGKLSTVLHMAVQREIGDGSS